MWKTLLPFPNSYVTTILHLITRRLIFFLIFFLFLSLDNLILLFLLVPFFLNFRWTPFLRLTMWLKHYSALRFTRLTGWSFYYSIFFLYRRSLDEGLLPSNWKLLCNPYLKSWDLILVGNYRSISILPQITKVFE